MTTSNGQNSRRWLDAAVFVTLLSAGLCGLGWVYWNTLLGNFGLSVEVIGLSFDQVISSTWWFGTILVPLVMVVLVAFPDREPWSGDDRKYFLIPVLLLAPIAAALVRGLGRPTYQAMLAFFGVQLFVVVLYKLLPKDLQLRRPSRQIVLGWGAWVIASVIYAGLAEMRARDLARGKGTPCVSIRTLTDSQPIRDLVLLARSSGLLFLIRPDTTGRTTGVTVVAEANIETATIAGDSCVR